MKQLRSRFRLITLLLACGFLLTLILCAGSALKTAGVTLDSLSSLSVVIPTASPDLSASPEMTDIVESTPSPSDALPPENVLPGTDISPVPEYNIFGL